jgi:hypothetical protein
VSDVSTLTDYAAELLDACSAAVATTIGGPIGRAFVASAVPALDCCPQLTVHVGGLQLEQTSPSTPVTAPGHKLTTTGMLILAVYVVTVVRCQPVGSENRQVWVAPTPAELAAAAIASDQDLWAIWNTVAQKHNAGELFGGRCPAIYFDPPIPLLVEGACGGWQISFRPAIDGYLPGV